MADLSLHNRMNTLRNASVLDKGGTNIIHSNPQSHAVRKMKRRLARRQAWSESDAIALQESSATSSPDHRRHSSAPSSHLFTLIEEPELNRWNSAPAASVDSLDDRRIDAAPILRKKADSPRMNESLGQLSLDDAISCSKIDLVLPTCDAMEPSEASRSVSNDVKLAPKTSAPISPLSNQLSSRKMNEPIGNENNRKKDSSQGGLCLESGV